MVSVARGWDTLRGRPPIVDWHPWWARSRTFSAETYRRVTAVVSDAALAASLEHIGQLRSHAWVGSSPDAVAFLDRFEAAVAAEVEERAGAARPPGTPPARPRRRVAAVEERGTYDIGEYADELAVARDNHEIGTSCQFENEHVRVWEVRLEPGERGAFHVHDQTYFWTVVEPGRGLQRFPDGTFVIRDYLPGETRYLQHSPDDALVHDLENVGPSTMRFVTVELKH